MPALKAWSHGSNPSPTKKKKYNKIQYSLKKYLQYTIGCLLIL
jgi:hypothetical protein